jgi:hypothetical protein
MFQKLKKSKFLIPLLLVLIALPTVLGMIGSGFYSLHDDMHPAWLYEMDQGIRSGQLPPRWAPDLSFNYGYPLFNFVYPLPFYLGEIFYLFGFSLVGSVKIVFLLSLLFSGLTMYFFLKRNFGSLFSFLGATLYLYTPYRAVDVYVRGAIGEALAFVFIPLVAWAIDRLVKEGGRKNLALTGIALALLILAHNIAFLMTIPFLLLYGLFLLFSVKEKRKAILNLMAGFGLGIGMAAFFWVPAFWEKGYMVADTVFDFWDHFPFIRQLIIPSWGYGISVWGIKDEMSFQIGMVNLLVVVLACLILFWLRTKLKKKDLVLFGWGLISLAIALFLMNIRSSFLWHLIPLLSYFQFPWRFLMMTTFLTAFFAGALEKAPLKPRQKKWLAILLLILAPIFTLSYFRPEKIFPERVDDYFMIRYFANKTKTGYSEEISPVYLTLKEEYLRLPLWVEERPITVPKAKMEVGEGEIIFSEESPTLWTAEVKTPETTKLIFHNYYYPGWQAYLDDQAREVEIKRPHGDISLLIPEGEHQICFKFTETPLRTATNLISLFSFIIALGLIVCRKKCLRIF